MLPSISEVLARFISPIQVSENPHLRLSDRDSKRQFQRFAPKPPDTHPDSEKKEADSNPQDDQKHPSSLPPALGEASPVSPPASPIDERALRAGLTAPILETLLSLGRKNKDALRKIGRGVYTRVTKDGKGNTLRKGIVVDQAA